MRAKRPYYNLDWSEVTHQHASLHNHSTNSDGTLSPTELVSYFATYGYTIVAVTDHDSVTTPPSVSGVYCPPGYEWGRGSTNHGYWADVIVLWPHQVYQESTNINTVMASGDVTWFAHPVCEFYYLGASVPQYTTILTYGDVVDYLGIEQCIGTELGSALPRYDQWRRYPANETSFDIARLWALNRGYQFFSVKTHDLHDPSTQSLDYWFRRFGVGIPTVLNVGDDGFEAEVKYRLLTGQFYNFAARSVVEFRDRGDEFEVRLIEADSDITKAECIMYGRGLRPVAFHDDLSQRSFVYRISGGEGYLLPVIRYIGVVNGKPSNQYMQAGQATFVEAEHPVHPPRPRTRRGATLRAYNAARRLAKSVRSAVDDFLTTKGR
jgi:hypothetical protein